MPESDDDLEGFIRAIPKTETHLHLEGALPYALLTQLDELRFPADPFFQRPAYRYPSFEYFETLLIEHAIAWFDSPERYHTACRKVFEGLAAQNVKYVEASFHLHMIEFIRADGHEILSAIRSAAPVGMELRIVGGMVRNGYTEYMQPIIDSLHLWDDLDGIDMHGQEWLALEEWAPPVWKRCLEAGKIVKVHAGEFGGPEKVREAMDRLGSRRIQHGVRASEDPDLVRRLADEGVVLDVCPLSNEKLRVVENLESHPLRELMQAGVICTINTDDPLCFGNDLLDEYRALAQRCGFDRVELGTLAKNGFEHARLNESDKREYIARIDRAISCK